MLIKKRSGNTDLNLAGNAIKSGHLDGQNQGWTRGPVTKGWDRKGQ